MAKTLLGVVLLLLLWCVSASELRSDLESLLLKNMQQLSAGSTESKCDAKCGEVAENPPASVGAQIGIAALQATRNVISGFVPAANAAFAVTDVFITGMNAILGTGTYDQFVELKNQLISFVSSSIDESEVRSQSRTFGERVNNAKENWQDFLEVYKQDNVSAINQLNEAFNDCELYGVLFNDNTRPGTGREAFSSTGTFVRARLVHLPAYCMLCGSVYAQLMQYSGQPNVDMVDVRSESAKLLKNCGVTAVAFVNEAINERMSHSSFDECASIELRAGGLVKTVCHQFDWSGNWNYKALDGYTTVVDWKEKGVCVFNGDSMGMGSPGECPAQDGGTGKLLAHAQRCVNTYRSTLQQKLWTEYKQTILDPSINYQLAYKCVLENNPSSGSCALPTQQSKWTGAMPKLEKDGSKCQANGQSCAFDEACTSATCARIAAGSDTLQCCAGRTTFGGYDYCTGRTDNTACWSNAMCGSGYCTNGILTKGVCITRRNNGEACAANGECISGKCARIAAGSDTLQCCAGLTTFGGLDYCTGRTDNTACWSNAMCSSGYCTNGILTKGVCITKRNNGAACAANGECISGSCARIAAGSDTLQCCAGLTTFGGLDYCTARADNTACWSNAMCSSGYCTNGVLTKGVCITKRNNGAACAANGECISGSCARIAAGSDTLQCCAGLTTFGGLDYCTARADNTACWSNAMCSSGYCTNGVLTKGVCITKRNNGAACAANGECISGSCARIAAGSDTLQCCAGKTTFGGLDYCTARTDNTACWSNAMCSSGYCTNGVLTKGVCITKRSIGAACSANGECSSGSCARIAAGSDTLQCCAGLTTFGGLDYCTGRTDNTACWSNAMCSSGYCTNGVLTKGVCLTKKTAWAACSSNSDCASGECNRTERDGNYKCCPSGTFYCYAWTSGDCKSAFYYCSGTLGH